MDGGGGGTGSSAASASSGTSATPPPPPPGAVGLGWWKWMYMCVCCVASSRGITLQEAKACIEEEDPMHQSKLKRAQGFAAARQKVLDGDDVQMMSGDRKSYKEVRAITLNFLEALLMPLAEYIIRKAAALDVLETESKEAVSLQAELKACKDASRAQAIIERLEHLKNQEHYLAFRDKPDQHNWIQAASFSDEFTVVKGLGAIRYWYLCMSGAATERCCTLVLSKRWPRLFEDPSQSGQRYYCPICGSKYKASTGVLVEVTRRTATGAVEAFYGRGEVPCWDAEDVRAMRDEAEKKPTSREDVYRMAVTAHPQVNELVRPAVLQDFWKQDGDVTGVYKIADVQELEALPSWDWYLLLNIPKPVKGKRR